MTREERRLYARKNGEDTPLGVCAQHEKLLASAKLRLRYLTPQDRLKFAILVDEILDFFEEYPQYVQKGGK